MNKKHPTQSGFFNLRILVTLFLFAVAACALLNRPLLAFLRSETSTNVSQRTLTFAERVAYQRTIENVYWRHRIWPEERPDLKPSLNAVMSQAQLEKKVTDYLRKSQALEDYWQQPITAEDLQAEMDRMGENTKQPEVLRELFDALGNDPLVIAECLARPVLSQRLMTNFAQGQRKCGLTLSEVGGKNQARKLILANASYTLSAISDVAGGGCTPDTWTPTSVPHAPPGRVEHTAVWTGSEMIVWGGARLNSRVNTGGRYDPVSDSWTKTSNTNAPTAREFHTAVWTGSEMIVWGGYGSNINVLNTGGRYNPGTDTWTATTTTDAPVGRAFHTAVWTDSEMIVWGGRDGPSISFDTGARYDPNTDNWTPTSTTNAPVGRSSHTAVWTGSEMIVWGGYGGGLLNTGGRYDVGSDSWTATTTANVPDAREGPTAVWTGSEMIIWGGIGHGNVLDTGGRYDVGGDSWTATTTTDAPSARVGHTAVWTGSEMITWGGAGYGYGTLNTGGRYCAQSGSPTPTPTVTATATATPTPTPTPTATARPSPTPRLAPTPRPRPTPPPRP